MNLNIIDTDIIIIENNNLYSYRGIAATQAIEMRSPIATDTHSITD
jgi:hypothetical protein